MHLIYSAWLADRVGIADEVIEITCEISVDGLMNLLSQKSKRHEAVFVNQHIIRAAINGNIVNQNTMVDNNSTITFFAPMAGG
jgi:molybdopterin converting factor small subunit